MFLKIVKRLFGNRNDRILNSIQHIVNAINDLEYTFSKLSDTQLKKKTKELKYLLLSKKKSLNDILPESFAVIREASKRVFSMRHFDVQLLGGIILHYNCIAEMKTGEGKTLTATLPAYLHALQGNGVHIVTMNNYLAKRDAKKNKILFNFLDMSVGLNTSINSIQEKKKAYLADITYGTSNEFCFDYLRDNMVSHANQRVQRGLNYVLIDEIDSILIDEARTPLIISGSTQDKLKIYKIINKIIDYLIQEKKKSTLDMSGDFVINKKYKQVFLTEIGFLKIEKLFLKYNLLKNNQELYHINHIICINYVLSALRARFFFIKDVHYIIKDKKVVIIDENTGRITEDRRWSDGLHQFIELKENLVVLGENQVLASITLQNYFKLYQTMSGMTGTAMTEAFEFRVIYNLDTVVIPTNHLMIRKDMPDLLFLTMEQKYRSIVKEIQLRHINRQPILVGTSSIEKSEIISNYLSSLNIKHNVLNAHFYIQEASIIAHAGALDAITIATNMAGRGTDIVLGGVLKNINDFFSFQDYQNSKIQWQKNREHVMQLGGLHVIGTERNESRRIDNQLIGRAGRQGDPGSSRFYLSMEDSLICLFIPRSIRQTIVKFLVNSKKYIENSWINKSVSNAQKKIENYNFAMRKQLLDYDNILNNQRNIIYHIRNIILDQKNIKNIIINYIKDIIINVIYVSDLKYNNSIEEHLNNIKNILMNDFNMHICTKTILQNNLIISTKQIFRKIYNVIKLKYIQKEQQYGYKIINKINKDIFIYNLDVLWREHLSSIEYLRKGIHLRAYANKEPKQEYQRESFNIFCDMIDILKYEIVVNIMQKVLFV
ncbi:Protein translocase subunit SecA [Buchnera aphidicola (Pterocallis alni)]|uniref:preprotein translocase subunit SecA n=1 Tax=Buchnera aphidicola TaxID=9 RepID=UPI003463F36B